MEEQEKDRQAFFPGAFGQGILISIDLESFKTEPCRNHHGTRKTRQFCLGYHSDVDKRRKWKKIRYFSSRCEVNCQDKQCMFSLNIIEEKYHPCQFKKKYCRKVLFGKCEFGEICPSAHGDEELRLVPLHMFPIDYNFLLFLFKTQFCPFSWHRHDAFSCVYAHNWQDFKRPYFSGQLAIACPSWKNTSRISSYYDDCPDGFSCRFCHGWKELDFHPSRLKSKGCVRPDHLFPNPQLLLSKALCSFSHPQDTSPKIPFLDFEHFEIVPRQIDYRFLSTPQFLLEVSGFEPLRPPNITFYKSLVVLFIEIEPEERTSKYPKTESANTIFR